MDALAPPLLKHNTLAGKQSSRLHPTTVRSTPSPRCRASLQIRISLGPLNSSPNQYGDILRPRLHRINPATRLRPDTFNLISELTQTCETPPPVPCPVQWIGSCHGPFYQHMYQQNHTCIPVPPVDTHNFLHSLAEEWQRSLALVNHLFGVTNRSLYIT
jgi:hypothetical protein